MAKSIFVQDCRPSPGTDEGLIGESFLKLVFFVIFDLAEPSPPQNLSTQSVNSTAILVSWQQPAQSNGKIKYRLSINTGSEQSAFYQVVYDGNNTQYLVSDLKPFTKYNLQVSAYNVKYNLSSSSVVAMETTGQAGRLLLGSRSCR